MVYLGIFSVILSGLGIGFGVFTLRHTKAVKIWGMQIKSGLSRRKLRYIGIGTLLSGVAVFLLSALLTYKVWVNLNIIFIIFCAFLWVLALIIGGVWGDFALARHRDFSKESLSQLRKIDALKVASQKLSLAYAAIIGFDGIAFIEKDGRSCCVLNFRDFELDDLSLENETDILCQYLKSIEPHKEIHSLTNKLSAVIDTPKAKIRR